jgi:hypothetical protein
MISVPHVVGILSCGFMLCLGLSPAAEGALAKDELQIDHSAASHGGKKVGKSELHETEGGQRQGGKTIKGEMLRVEGANCFVKGREEKEGRLRIDETTPKVRYTLEPATDPSSN